MKFRNLPLAVMLALGLMWGVPRAMAQAGVSGAIQGVITDPSGAALTSATVSLKNVATGASQSGTVDNKGEFRFSLLPPSTYILTVTAKGFATVNGEETVSIGQVTPANIKMKLSSGTQTVEVSGAAPLIQTQTANTTSTLSEKQVDSLPIPGRDINYLALLSPGAIMVAGGSFPSVQGLPTTSNLYTVNGMEDIDPWNNSTNGGASNLLLGMNEVQESTEVSNGFNGSYGELAGSNVNMVTKSGGNQFHGNLEYDWTGRAMESNDFFFNKNGETRPFVNANQWAGSFGGPIFKNKLFFFVDNEGIALVLPGSATPVFVPTTQFQTATLANLANVQPSEVPFYKEMFSLWNSAPGASTAAPTPNTKTTTGGCSVGFSLAGGAACSDEYYSAETNTSHEIVTTFRIDYNISSTDHAYFHFLLDRGVQDTGVDPINPAFDAISHQPEFNGQFSETHNFGSTSVNQFQAAAQNYKALFGPSDLPAALAVFPTTMAFSDGSFTNLGGSDNDYPEGRDVTRYQFSDDYSHLFGNHSFQAGVYFSRYDATDFQFGEGTSGLLTSEDMQAFYNGGYAPTAGDTADISTYSQSYPAALQQPLALYRLGMYAQDEWHVTSNLSLTGALRVDHPSNPVCVDDCFADTTGWYSMAHGASVPYNTSITPGLANGLPSLQAIQIEPRVGFAWQPFGTDGKTALRGGWGMFADNFPLDTITGFATNPPEDPSFAATASDASGFILAPGMSNSLNTQTANSYSALATGFAAGDTLAQLQAAAPGFTLPSLTTSDSKIINPMYYKWNLDLERQLWKNAAIDIAYDGNHGIHELMENTNVNAYDPAGFVGLPTAPVDPRFLEVIDYQSDGISNYNGMTSTFNDRFSSGVLMVTYTWSHSLDDGIGTSGTKTTQYPTDLMQGYGPSDQDYRHYAAASYLWNAPFQQWFGGPKLAQTLERDWEVTGTVIARSGGPIYVYNTDGTLSADGYGGKILSTYNGGVIGGSCSTPSTPCFTASKAATSTTPAIAGEFSTNTAGFTTTQSRNMFRGPGYWNTNLTLMRHFTVPMWERGQWELGANAYNLFNHPNFGNPQESETSSTFGTITTMVDPSSSPLGSNGADTSVRIVQLHLGVRF